ncbi:MAG TPA: lytic murein transglycosylase [Xanthobacteraceae bacterium]|nr:lytic murein transglycosylase [Xanthobacteraceae bacterium]
MRPLLIMLALIAALSPARADQIDDAVTSSARVSAFLDALWVDAHKQGITRATFDRALAGFTPDPRVIAATHREPEYGKPVGDYVNAVASRARIAEGAAKAAQWARLLATIEQRYGVERWIVLALWGIESSYGAESDRWDVIRSLATLAQARYRDPYFRGELLIALRILQEGHVARERMLGSWAGAMGQPQFMPSSFYTYAVDFTGDGRRDIWTSVPDVLASIANYLARSGWQRGLPWGYEVVLPAGFDYRRSHGSFAEWTQLGVRRTDEGALPRTGDGFLLFPSGAAGPAFLVTANFNVIKTYNNSDVYALSVGHLADRMHGGPPFRAVWPRDDPQLSRDARMTLQHKLAELGYPVHDFAGRLDFAQRDMIRELQVKLGLVSDGQPTPALMRRLGLDVR